MHKIYLRQLIVHWYWRGNTHFGYRVYATNECKWDSSAHKKTLKSLKKNI